MGRQIRIYIDENDARVLEKNVTSQNDVLILHNRSRGPFPQIIDTTDLIEDGDRHYFFYFVRADAWKASLQQR